MMNKRKLGLKNVDNTKKKKVIVDQEKSITSIENFSNELFHEIFDYIEGCKIYHAFSNLNYRFQQLLNSSSLQFKISSVASRPDETYMNNFKQIIQFNRQQIFAIELFNSLQINEFSSSFVINSSYDHLESLDLWEPQVDILLTLLPQLASLPRLFSLSVNMIDILMDYTDVFRIIFTLPVLKYLKYLTNCCECSTSLSIATNHQLSPIEVLILDVSCTLEQLAIITSYTPQLRRLNIQHIDKDNDPLTGILLPKGLSNLTHITIGGYGQTFDEFEMFISQICSKLEFLSLTKYNDIAYVDAKQWEIFILKYCPQLKQFYFRYYEPTPDDYDYPIYDIEPNQFTSPFWTERKWIFEAKPKIEHMRFSIRPYKKQWYDYSTQYGMINSSVQFAKSSLIKLSYIFDELLNSYLMEINFILNLQRIYHLEITHDIFIGTLIQITDALPELISLKIHSLLLHEPRKLCAEEVDILCSIEDTSKITSVYLKKAVEIEEVYFLMTFCPYMTYLKVDYMKNMNIELFLRSILEKINSERNAYLRLLCFNVRAADDKVIKKIEKMIHDEKLLIDYTIKREVDNIYLKWK